MTQAFVCIGSNMGDAEKHLLQAHEALNSIPGVRISGASSLYRTEPQGRRDQPWFLNQVLRLDCEEGVTALSLLDAMLEKELEMGRVRDAGDRFGPRVLRAINVVCGVVLFIYGASLCFTAAGEMFL